ncbi:hypothetical protein XU18_3337 [Perkinsela sp. CCAP 1560/4]|nr:hypothetical protein XU18_3337 [Perkinsela sp. CCAP 1560/4]|eukprot:KNH05669.1 hypothetical protein XU18_3337 [Perkinsela sp. CCAP 1560/4]
MVEDQCYAHISDNQRFDLYRERGREFCEMLMAKLEKDELDNAALKDICSEMVESTMPKFIGEEETNEKQQPRGSEPEAAPVVPGIKVSLQTPHSDNETDTNCKNEFSSLPQYKIHFDPETMVPKYDIEDALTYTSRKNMPAPNGQSPIEQIDSVTRSSIKNLNSFAQRSKDFSRAAQKANLDEYRDLTEIKNSIPQAAAKESLSNFGSSPEEFWSPYDSTMVFPPGI